MPDRSLGMHADISRSHLKRSVRGIDLELEVVILGACLERPLAVGGFAEPEWVTVRSGGALVRMRVLDPSLGPGDE